ncbi:MAG: RNA polymerase sigma factor [Bryobacteraceae bacterium]
MTEAEFKTIFREHKDAVYGFAWRMTGSPAVAEDATQDCFVALLRDQARFDGGRGSLRAFLIGVTRNQIRKRWRAEGRWDPIDEDSFVAEPFDAERMETVDLVAKAVQALPPLQRETLILTEYDEMSLQDVARAVEAEVGTVKARLHRARENLRRMLAPLRRPPCNP